MRESKEEIEIKLDENHTLCNLLTDEIRKDKSVVACAYKIEHPLKKEFKIFVKTSGKDVRKVIKESIERLEKQLMELYKQLKE